MKNFKREQLVGNPSDAILLVVSSPQSDMVLDEIDLKMSFMGIEICSEWLYFVLLE